MRCVRCGGDSGALCSGSFRCTDGGATVDDAAGATWRVPGFVGWRQSRQLSNARYAATASPTAPTDSHTRWDDFPGRSEFSHAAIGAWD